MNRLDLSGGIDLLEPVKERPGIQGCADDKRQSALADLLAALGVALNRALCFADGLGCSGSKRQVVACCALSREAAADVLSRLRVEFQIDRLAPGCLTGPLGGEQFSPAVCGILTEVLFHLFARQQRYALLDKCLFDYSSDV